MKTSKNITNTHEQVSSPKNLKEIFMSDKEKKLNKNYF